VRTPLLIALAIGVTVGVIVAAALVLMEEPVLPYLRETP
jgi:hypothetical protein